MKFKYALTLGVTGHRIGIQYHYENKELMIGGPEKAVQSMRDVSRDFFNIVLNLASMQKNKSNNRVKLYAVPLELEAFDRGVDLLKCCSQIQIDSVTKFRGII